MADTRTGATASPTPAGQSSLPITIARTPFDLASFNLRADEGSVIEQQDTM